MRLPYPNFPLITYRSWIQILQMNLFAFCWQTGQVWLSMNASLCGQSTPSSVARLPRAVAMRNDNPWALLKGAHVA